MSLSSGSSTGIVTVTILPDSQGRFGFNVKGGADQGVPVIVSRVAGSTPADRCVPRLNEGDQVAINYLETTFLKREDAFQYGEAILTWIDEKLD